METTSKNTNSAQGERHSSEPRKDVYSIVTDRIIEKLSEGVIPWLKPWTEAGVPINVISQRPYRGINIMLLAMLGYDHNKFLTFKQLTEVGGKVKKGEKSHIVVFWNYVERQQQESEKRDDGVPTQGKKVPMLRYYNVFNISQCENLPDELTVKTENATFKPIETCEAILEDMKIKPTITFKKDGAFYDVLRDYINMPKYNSFLSPDAYYSTLFHEIIHWTGHKSRLDRKGLTEMSEFGSDPYSMEELIAEIGTCYIQSFADITTEFANSAAYIQHWLGVLKNDSRVIFTASTAAQRATDYILNVKDVVEDRTQKSA